MNNFNKTRDYPYKDVAGLFNTQLFRNNYTYEGLFFFQDAYNHVKKCRENMQPTRGFIEQLSRWEEKMFGSIVTNISEPEY